MTVFLALLAAFVAVGSVTLVAIIVADRVLPGTDVTVRMVGALCLAYWWLAWGFQLLGLAGLFRPWATFALAIGPLLWLRLRAGSAWLQDAFRSLSEARAEGSALLAEVRRPPWLTLGLGLIGLHVAVRVVRTWSTPAFGWDDFTYHLFRAGRWVQTGSLALEPAPDAWTYYEFFPWGGDLLWAWGLVWGAGDLPVALAAVALWIAVPLAAYAVGRELGAERPTALVVAIAIALLPSQISQISTAYVDNAVLAAVLATSLFLLVFLRDEAAADRSEASGCVGGAAFLVGVGCGLGLLVKMSFLPLLAPAGVILFWHAWTSRRPQVALAFVGGLAVAMPNLVFNWVQRGSPFYPFEIVPGLPFNEQHSWILSKYGEGATVSELTRAAKALVVNLFPLDPFLNLGFVAVCLTLLGGFGAWKVGGQARGRWFLLWVSVGAFLTAVSFFSPRNSSMVVWWTLMMGRFLAPSLAGLMVLSSLASPLWIRRLLFPVLVVEYFVYARRGWPEEQGLAALQVALLVGVLVGVIVLTYRRHWSSWVRRGVVVITAVLVCLGIVGVREVYRFDAYRQFAARELLDFHGAPPMSAWPIWQRLDETGPQRVAATAGFDGLTGHNWFRAALLGRWLQNDVVYLPVTLDGELVSYRDRSALVEAADRESWLQRIRDAKIDRVVALGPANIEHRWILDLPEIFEVEISMGNDHFLLAQVVHEALAGHLASRQ